MGPAARHACQLWLTLCAMSASAGSSALRAVASGAVTPPAGVGALRPQGPSRSLTAWW